MFLDGAKIEETPQRRRETTNRNHDTSVTGRLRHGRTKTDQDQD